jgi:hypothetical protein
MGGVSSGTNGAGTWIEVTPTESIEDESEGDQQPPSGGNQNPSGGSPPMSGGN